MAERRMFSKKIIDTDWFMDMSASAQNLYFHLSMRADDDGFVSSPKRIMKLIGSAEDDYKILVAKKFIIPFESGVCVITDWRINNYLRNDRYTETIYKEEKKTLLLDENGKYNLGIPTGYQLDTQDSIGKDSIDKSNIKKVSKKEESFDDIINSMCQNEELKNTLYDFIKMRKVIKKPLTNRALKSIINKVKKLSNGKGSLAIAILDQSITNCWQDVYELRNNNNNNTQTKEPKQDCPYDVKNIGLHFD